MPKLLFRRWIKNLISVIRKEVVVSTVHCRRVDEDCFNHVLSEAFAGEEREKLGTFDEVRVIEDRIELNDVGIEEGSRVWMIGLSSSG